MTCFRLKNGKTASQFCKENQISYGLVYRRLERGMQPDEACEEVLKRKGKKAGVDPKYFYKGKPLADILITNSKKYSRVMYRIKQGFPIEQAVEVPRLKVGRKKKK